MNSTLPKAACLLLSIPERACLFRHNPISIGWESCVGNTRPASLNPGVYIVQVTDGNEIYSSKLLKQ
ncbi:T9SS type A sorting domain-containing protein [Chitinophaga sp. CF118]|uniref:T9SS type A sorting domain-containing protein n=1 Tax=Chitinophaga sp. CF118 TaxID=1884367 RepID=UPI000B7DD079|nr:T9SS type A sorting domain-containing protein [Chitinophaga sp. CF118]